MTARKTESAVQITPAIVHAFAEFLEAGNVSSLEEFAASEAGQTAAKAMQDQKEAELRSNRMGQARAVAKDLKVNGHLSSYSKDRAIALRDWLATVDFDSLPESLPMPKRGGKDEAEDDATENTDSAAE